MSSTIISQIKIHKLVEYVKGVGFYLETDELESANLTDLLAANYDLYDQLSKSEEAALRRELWPLAVANEVNEALVKGRELFPVDEGVVLVHGKDNEGKASAHPVSYRYPVVGALREVPAYRASFPSRKEALSGSGGNQYGIQC